MVRKKSRKKVVKTGSRTAKKRAKTAKTTTRTTRTSRARAAGKKTGKAAARRRQFKPSDYSAVGQSPIRLKEKLSADAGPDEGRSLVRPRKRKVSTRKKTAVAVPAGSTQWTVRGFSSKSKEQAKEAAQQAGLPVGQWLENAVARAVDQDGEGDGQEAQRKIDALERRLALLEEKRSFWDRLADFVRRYR